MNTSLLSLWPKRALARFALFNLGFRPFFLLASISSFVSMLVWGCFYVYGWQLPRMNIAPQLWHGHEMVFGYAFAVVSGFLLTAIRNWTNISTVSGVRLALLVMLWLAARLVWLVLPNHLIWALILDFTFGIGLIASLTIPVIKAKQYKQLGIIAKIVLLLISNLTFYLGALGTLPIGMHWGLYSGLYLIVSLIFVLGRRVIPFFIERGVGYSVTLINHTWVDRLNLILFFAFWIVDVFLNWPWVASLLAALLVVVHSVRLVGWYTSGIWHKPLLWVLYLGYCGAVSGFLLKALSPMLGLSPFLSLHAFAVGGIGMITVGMMSRVALGHTGRNIQQPPRLLTPIFALLAIAFTIRVVLPALFPGLQVLWIGLAQAAWLGAFGMFSVIYFPILIRPRVDGQPG